MKPKTEEFLNFLLWSAEQLCRPTVRNLTDSYEAWAYRQGLLRQVATLTKQGLLEQSRGPHDDRLYRLTEQGRLRALGGSDPQIQWARKWDACWRLVIFDVPETENIRRDRLRRYLRGRGFGCLQGSVWITPDPLAGEREVLAGGTINVKSLILLNAKPCAGESDAQIVAGAWDFDKINKHYAKHAEILEQRPNALLRDSVAAKALQLWAGAEREAWLEAVSNDPLLPERLLPDGYLGCATWRRRTEVLREAGEQLRSFYR
jgi:DNA-binding transcriptional regulator PaaX